MGILQAPSVLPGQVGVLGAIKYMVSTDNVATITAAGYLNNIDLSVNPILASDVLGVTYSYNLQTNSGSFTFMTPSISNGVITLVELVSPGNVLLPVVSGNVPKFNGTSGQIEDSGIAASSLIVTSNAAGQTIAASSASATPGTIRALTGAMTESNTVMTSGNVVGARGSVNMVGASGGFVYGAQGKVLPTGTISGSVWIAGVFGQFDLSAATITTGQLACLWGDMGTTATAGTYTGLRGIAMTNTTAAICNSQVYLYGGATNLLELADNNGLVGATYFVAAGTSGGSAGDAAHCAASKVLKITVNGTNYWLPLFASNS